MAHRAFFAMFAVVLACPVQAQQPNEPAHKTMLLIGCLQTVPESLTFKLVGVTLEAPGAGVPGSAAQPKPTGTSGKGGEYELTTDNSVGRSGAEPVDLRMYTGRRVQITARSPEPADESSFHDLRPNSTVEKERSSEEQKPQPLIVVGIKELSMPVEQRFSPEGGRRRTPRVGAQSRGSSRDREKGPSVHVFIGRDFDVMAAFLVTVLGPLGHRFYRGLS